MHSDLDVIISHQPKPFRTLPRSHYNTTSLIKIGSYIIRAEFRIVNLGYKSYLSFCSNDHSGKVAHLSIAKAPVSTLEIPS